MRLVRNNGRVLRSINTRGLVSGVLHRHFKMSGRLSFIRESSCSTHSSVSTTRGGVSDVTPGTTPMGDNSSHDFSPIGRSSAPGRRVMGRNVPCCLRDMGPVFNDGVEDRPVGVSRVALPRRNSAAPIAVCNRIFNVRIGSAGGNGMGVMSFGVASGAGSFSTIVLPGIRRYSRLLSGLGGKTRVLVFNRIRCSACHNSCAVGPGYVDAIRVVRGRSGCPRGHIRLRLRAGVSRVSNVAPPSGLIRHTVG